MKIIEFLAKIPLQLALVILGVLLLILGAGDFGNLPEGLSYQKQHPVALMSGGVALIVFSAALTALSLRTSKRGALSATDYSVRFNSPTNRSLNPTTRISAEGSVSPMLPADYQLWLLRRWHTNNDTFRVVQKSTIRSVGDKIEWGIVDGYLGGAAGDTIILEMWLVGPDGSRMLSAWDSGMKQYAQLMRETGTPWRDPWYFPGLPAATSDMTLAATVEIIRT